MTAELSDSRQPGSITQWIPGLRHGDQRAIQVLWEHYFEPLARLAEARLRGCPGAAGNGEDVAVEAFLSFCADARRDGHFPDLSRRDNVMRLLVRFTVCKAFDFRVREVRRRRVVLGESVLGEAGFEPIAGREPPPEFQAQVASLLDKLDKDLRPVAQLRMEGRSNQEIAAAIGRAVATVERRLSLIRGRWKADWDALRGECDAQEERHEP